MMPQTRQSKRRSAPSKTSPPKRRKSTPAEEIKDVSPIKDEEYQDNNDPDDDDILESDGEEEIIEEEIDQEPDDEPAVDSRDNDSPQHDQDIDLNLEHDGENNEDNGNEDFDTRSEATSDSGRSAGAENDDEPVYDDDYEKETYDDRRSSDDRDSRGISPIVFNRSDTSDEEEDVAPPGESEEEKPKKSIVIPPAEIRTQRRDRHSKMLKYLFRDARFFVIKSNNHENVSLAKAKGVWSTPPSNEHKLTKAFKESRNVILIFSVRESGAFQGFARISTEARHDYGPIHWVLPAGLSARALGGVFKIDWMCRRELSFIKTGDIRNPFNDNKPVKIGRDGQEVEPNAGKVLCLEFPHDDGVDLESIIHRVRKREKEMGNVRYEVPRYPVPDNGPRSRAARSGRGKDFNRGPRTFPRRDDGGGRDPRSYSKDNYSPRFKDFRSRGRFQGRRNQHNDGGYQYFRNFSSDHVRNEYEQPASSYPSLMSTFTSYQSSNYQDVPPLMQQYVQSPYQTSNKPSSAVISKYSDGSRISSRTNDSSLKSSSSISRSYDSRAHAAACDDFVRRVAAGRSGAVASSSSRSNERSQGREHTSRSSRSERENRHSRR
ncbi:uncharacterized protein LOC120340598 [Styela clava]